MLDKDINNAFEFPNLGDPEFVTKMLNTIARLHGKLYNLIEECDESTRNVYDGYNRMLDSLKNELSNENLEFEKKQWILKEMKEITDKIDVKDSEYKNYKLKIVGGVLGSIALAVAGALGLNREKPKNPAISWPFGKKKK